MLFIAKKLALPLIVVILIVTGFWSDAFRWIMAKTLQATEGSSSGDSFDPDALTAEYLGTSSAREPTQNSHSGRKQASATITQIEGIIELDFSGKKLRAEVAADDKTRKKGLMHRKDLPFDQGMLFVYDIPGRYCFWMKNTPLPLSIAFIAPNGRISSIKHMKARDRKTSHCSPAGTLYALEVNKGWYAANGIKLGQKIGGLERLL